MPLSPAVPSRPSATGAETQRPLQSDGDRFVALAFCWADILVELDGEGRVVFTAGPLGRLLGAPDASLAGRKLSDLIADHDRPLFEGLLAAAERRGRLEGASVHLKSGAGASSPFSVSGYRLAELGGHYFVGFRKAAIAQATAGGRNLKRDSETGLYDAQSFAALVKDQTAAGADTAMTLVQMPGFAALRERLGEQAGDELVSAVGAMLKANSVGGDAAATIGEGRYGVLHEAGADITALERELVEMTRALDPSGQGVKVETATVETDDDAMSPEDLANGLVFAINKFRSAEGAQFSLKQLSSHMGDLVSSAVKNVNTFKQTVAKGDF